MSALFFVLAFLIVALFVYMGRYSGRVNVEQSRFIAAAPEAVQAAVADLGRWQAWNPWLEHARDTPASVDGNILSWDLPQVGRARLRRLEARAPGSLRQHIDFKLPFALRGRSDWRFEPAPGGTQVHWRFKGRVAFTLRAFAATVQGATALDLRFGLDHLAATLEARPPAYRLDYLGVQAQPARQHAQAPHRGPLDGLAAAVQEQLAAAGLAADGTATVHYLKTQLKLRIVDCRVGLELPGAAALPEGLSLHEEPAHPALVVRFQGPAEALELAWYQAMQRLRVEQRQPDPRLPPCARYEALPRPGEPVAVMLQLPLRP